jgi:hypothetical protein
VRIGVRCRRPGTGTNPNETGLPATAPPGSGPTAEPARAGMRPSEPVVALTMAAASVATLQGERAERGICSRAMTARKIVLGAWRGWACACVRCGHAWMSKSPTAPKRCASCKAPNYSRAARPYQRRRALRRPS